MHKLDRIHETIEDNLRLKFIIGSKTSFTRSKEGAGTEGTEPISPVWSDGARGWRQTRPLGATLPQKIQTERAGATNVIIYV